MKIYFIRHGQTDYNVEHRIQGMWGNSRLTEKGKEQAIAARTLVEGIAFDRIYVSTADRTKSTAALLFPYAKDIILSDDLRELDTGRVTDRLIAEARTTFVEEYKQADATGGYESLGGESVEMVTERARRVVAHILAGGGETVAVVTHGGLLRYLLAVLLSVPSRTFALSDNCGVTLVEAAADKAYLRYYNRTASTATPATEAL